MKKVCLYLQVHHPMLLKRYRFFNMGRDVHYLDDYANRRAMEESAEKCYLPMNKMLLSMIEKHKFSFKVSFAISGLAIEQMKIYAPAALDSFKALAETGCVEFVSSPYSWSLSSLASLDIMRSEIIRQNELIYSEFKQKPKCFVNSDMIYSDRIGEAVADLGFTAMITEGAKHILGWKSPNFVYANAENPRLKLLLRNYRFSDELRYLFSDESWNMWPITSDKYIDWIEQDSVGSVTNIFLDYNTFGLHHGAESGIQEFFGHFVDQAIYQRRLEFAVPSEVASQEQPVAVLHVPHAISWADDERDITAWLGNELQDEAFDKLYKLQMKVQVINDENMNKVWDFMSCSNNFYYMSTKWFSDTTVGHNDNPYDSPYEAFINYMNIFSDFEREVNMRYEGGEVAAPAKPKKPRAPRATAAKKPAAPKTTAAKKPATKRVTKKREE